MPSLVGNTLLGAQPRGYEVFLVWLAGKCAIRRTLSRRLLLSFLPAPVSAVSSHARTDQLQAAREPSQVLWSSRLSGRLAPPSPVFFPVNSDHLDLLELSTVSSAQGDFWTLPQFPFLGGKGNLPGSSHHLLGVPSFKDPFPVLPMVQYLKTVMSYIWAYW